MGKDYKVLSSSKAFPVEALFMFGVVVVRHLFLWVFFVLFPHSASGGVVVVLKLFSSFFSFAGFALFGSIL